MQCVNISIAMDNLLENTELLSVVLGSRDDRVKLGDRIARIYIIDSDGKHRSSIIKCVALQSQFL